MHQHEREKCARDRRTVAILNDITDEINRSRHLVDASFLVAERLTKDDSDPLMTLLGLISEKLQTTADEIQARVAKEVTDVA